MGIAISLIGLVGSAYLLARIVGRFRRDWREAEVARSPALPEQTISIPISGDLRIFLEGPRYRTWSKRPAFMLTDTVTGHEIPVHPTCSGSGVRSTTRSRVERGRFLIERPGAYLLRAGGMEPVDRGEYAFVIMRPFTRELITFILSCVVLGVILVGSLVGAILSLAL